MFLNFNRIANGILFTLISLRIIARAFLPHAYIVPDESTWSSLTDWFVEGKDRTQFDGFDRTPFYGAQSLIVPSAWQVEFLNISSLSAVRNTSLLYGIGSLIIFFYSIKLITRRKFSDLSKREFIFAMTSLLTFGLMPSHLFWSLAGLRDSASEFFLLLTVFFTCKSLLYKDWRSRALPLVALASILSFSARAQTAWVLCALLFLVGLHSISTKVKRPELIALSVISFLMGQFVSEIPEKIVKTVVMITQGDKSIKLTLKGNQIVEQNSEGLSLEFENGKLKVVKSMPLEVLNPTEELPFVDEVTWSKFLDSLGDVESGEETRFEVKNQVNTETNVLQGATKPLERARNLSYERAVKREGAESAISGPECNRVDSNLQSYSLCLGEQAIFQFFSFLFRPLPFETSTSQEFMFASYENLLWLLIFVLILYFWIKFRWRPSQIDLIPLTFFILFAPAAALTQGNLGTAMRHKSIVLWTFLWLAISIYFYNRKKISTRQVVSKTDT